MEIREEVPISSFSLSELITGVLSFCRPVSPGHDVNMIRKTITIIKVNILFFILKGYLLVFPEYPPPV